MRIMELWNQFTNIKNLKKFYKNGKTLTGKFVKFLRMLQKIL